jgi:cytochrome b6-f complex iron-sulfur subunit
MTRQEFLKIAGIGALAAVTILGHTSCSSSSPNTPSNVDFTIDLNDSANSALLNIGGYLIKNGVIVAYTNDKTYVAVSAACTHEGTNVDFVKSQNDFVCPSHNSKFTTTGKVIQGPAKKDLTQYKVDLNNNVLHIYS